MSHTGPNHQPTITAIFEALTLSVPRGGEGWSETLSTPERRRATSGMKTALSFRRVISGRRPQAYGPSRNDDLAVETTPLFASVFMAGGGAPSSELRRHPPHPPSLMRRVPSLSPRMWAERANASQFCAMMTILQLSNSHRILPGDGGSWSGPRMERGNVAFG